MTASVGAQEAPGPVLSFERPRTNWGGVPTGADLGLTWGNTKLVFGAGYENYNVGRDWLTGDPRELLGYSPAISGVSLPNGAVSLRQFVRWDGWVSWAGAGVVGYGDLGLGNPLAGIFADRGGGTFGYGEVGLVRNGRTKNPHGVTTGPLIEFLLQGSPAVASARGTDYYKATVLSSVLLPLWDLEAPTHLFSGVWGFRANAQWIDGRSVPFPLWEETDVRGYDRLLDTKLRTVATTELRVGLPSLWGVHDVVPLVLAFAEGGWYWGYVNSATASTRSGWLASAGSGVGLSIFNVVTLNLTAALPLSDGESDLWWRFKSSLRF